MVSKVKPSSLQEFLARLRRNGRVMDAIRFLAFALPRKDAVRWGCACIGRVIKEDADRAAHRALEAASRWVEDSNETNRRAAGEAAELAGFNTPAGCLAAAAFWSGASLAPVGLPEVAPGPDLTARG